MTRALVVFLAALLPFATLSAAEEDSFGAIYLDSYVRQCPPVDTLKTLRTYPDRYHVSMWAPLSFFNTDFIGQGKIESVQVLEDRPELSYKTWFQEHPAPVAFLIPGFGSHYSSLSQAAIGEELFDKGFSVVSLTNPFHPDFMDAAGSVATPGYLPRDAVDLRVAIGKILEKIAADKSRVVTGKVLAGYSLGGAYTLFIAEAEGKKNKLGVDRYVAINPPVDLLYALRQLDAFYDTWRKSPRTQVNPRFLKSALTLLGLMNGKIPVNAPLPMTADEAKIIIGYAFRMQLRETIFCAHKRHNLKSLNAPYSWFCREYIYKEIDELGFERYVNTLVTACYAEKLNKPVSLKKMNDTSSLRSLEATLKKRQDVKIVHSVDDFLITTDDVRWLRATLGDRLILFKGGSHLGDLYLEQVQAAIVDALALPPDKMGSPVTPPAAAVSDSDKVDTAKAP